MLAFMLAGIAVVGTAFAMMARINLRRFLGYNNAVDIVFTIAMLVMFHGTFSGIVSASFAGLVMSLALYVSRAAIGYERLERRGMRLVWVRYDPPARIQPAIQWVVHKVKVLNSY